MSVSRRGFDRADPRLLALGVAKPLNLLANVYLHYVFDLWIEAWRKKVARDDVIVVRYADDLVVVQTHGRSDC
jgi:predicted phosphohydrolase